MITCQQCGMLTKSAGEYHPYAACLLFRACGNGDEVRANLADVQAARATAEQSTGTWISVDERFPPDGEMVLVCVRNGVQSANEDAEEYECEVVHVVDFGQFKEPGGYMECFAGPHGAFADDITHWQPLPAPPVGAAIESQRSGDGS